MATDAAPELPQLEDGWTPARMFLLVSTAYHLLLGVAGLAIDRTFPIGADTAEHAGSGHVFGVFETNGWHSVAGVLIGIASLYFALRPERSREAALAIGISQVFVVVAFALFPPTLFWFASNGADQVIHSITAVGGIGSALLTRPARSGPSSALV